MIGFFERDTDSKSMMRLLAFMGFCLGGLVTGVSLILIWKAVVAALNGTVGAVEIIGSLILLASAGMALAGGGEVMKVVQQRSESKQTQVTETGSVQSVTTTHNGSIEAGGGL